MFANDKRAPSGLERIYEPKSIENNDKGRPLRVRLSVPTERQRRNFYAASTEDELKTVGANWEVKYSAIRACLLGVENYWRYDCEGNEVPIEAAEDFIEYGQSAVVAEVGDEIITNFSLVSEEVAKAKK